MLSELREVPLPEREPVTLRGGRDPHGVLPGLEEALSRRKRILQTQVHCPSAPVSYALEKVLVTPGEVEVHVALFATLNPEKQNLSIATLTLRFQTGSGHLEGRVVPRAAQRHARTRSRRRAQAMERAVVESEALLAPQFDIEIEDEDEDEEPEETAPEAETTQAKGPARTGTHMGASGSLARLLGLFFLFLATVGTWRIYQANQEARQHDEVNAQLAEQERSRRQKAGEETVSTTQVRLGSPPVITGALDADDLLEALLAPMVRLESCYRTIEGVKTLPAEGDMVLTVDFGGKGQVREVTLEQDSLESEEVARCAVDVLYDLSGQVPEDGHDAQVALSFTFRG